LIDRTATRIHRRDEGARKAQSLVDFIHQRLADREYRLSNLKNLLTSPKTLYAQYCYCL